MPAWSPFKKKEENTPEQTKSDADLLVERFSAAMDERLKPVADKVTELSSKFQKIEEEAVRSLEPDPNKNADGTDLSETEKLNREKQALFAITVQTNARITESECIDAIRTEWPQLVEKAREVFKSTPWQRKAQPDYSEFCGNVVDMLVGKEARKAGVRYDASGSRFFVEDASGKTGGAESPFNDPSLTWQDPRNPDKILTASQQLEKLRIDPKEFAKFMEGESH